MNTVTVNQDKQGFYRSTDKETYKKLRKVRFFAHVERIQQARHQRWSRKLPHNRVKWVFAGLYSKVMLSISFTEWKAEPWEEPELCPINLDILRAEYKNAQAKYDNPDKIVNLKLDNTGLDAMISQLYIWSDRVYGHRR